MTGDPNRLQNPKPGNNRPRVREVIESLEGRDDLLWHIKTELKRLDPYKRNDPDDIFQDLCVHGLDPGREGPRGDPVNWLKRIATHLIIDELRKYRSRDNRNGNVEVENECSEVMDFSVDDADEVLAASAYLNPQDQRIIELVIKGYSIQAIASTLGLRNEKSARDAKCRAKRRLRNVILALRGE